MKPITLPSVIIKKDKQGNILSSAPLDTKDVKSTNEIIYKGRRMFVAAIVLLIVCCVACFHNMFSTII